MALRTTRHSPATSGGGDDAFLAASWERSRSAGVNIDTPSPDYCADFDTSSRLARCARPVLEQLDTNIADVALVIALTDSRARLIERIDVTKGMGHMVDKVEFAPGFSYAEDTMGTNGVGTVIESGRAASIVGDQHYCEKLHPFACTATPVIEPISGRIEGTLDVTTVAGAWSPLMHTLVTTAAHDIGRRLLADRSRAQQELFEAYLRADARAGRRAVFAFSGSVTMANSVAHTLFDSAEQTAIRDHAQFILGRRARVVDSIELAPGRIVRIRSARIDGLAQKAGTIVVAELTDSLDDVGGTVLDSRASAPEISHLQMSSRSALAPLLESNSPAWIRACKQLLGSLESREPALVFGEPGTGRNTLPVELMQSIYPEARIIVVEASDIDDQGEAALPAVDAHTEGAVLVVIRDVDQLVQDSVQDSNDALLAIVARVEAAEGDVALVCTSRSSALPHGLLAHFEASVVLPPLRNRTEDLDLICRRILVELAPGRKVTISLAAQRTIAAFSWPRNVAQLREALGKALEKRPVGEIQVEDLPCYCRVTSPRRSLSPIQVAERDAIIAALTEHGGNRVAAAEHVGISRSSLYRKMRSYGINC